MKRHHASRCCKRGRGMQKHEWVVGCCSENFGCGEAARTVLLARCFNVQARRRSQRYSHITASPALRWEGGTRSGGQLRGPSAPARPGRTKSTQRTSPLDDIGAPRPAPPGRTKSAPRPRAPEPSAALAPDTELFVRLPRCISVRLQLWVPARGTTVEQHVCSACGAPALIAAY